LTEPPILALVTAIVAALSFALVRAIQHLRLGFQPWLAPAIAGGIAAGVAHEFLESHALLHKVTVAAAFVAVAWFVSVRHADAAFSDGIFAGAVSGTIAAIIASVASAATQGEIAMFPALGSIAAAIVFAVPVASRLTRSALAAVAVLVTVFIWTPIGSILESQTPLVVIAVIALAGLVADLARWPAMRRELAEEARLGLIDFADAAVIFHPIRRFRLSQWRDRQARREFVRLATSLAELRLRQKRMTAAAARLYQLEILKLRMQVEQMEQVEAAVRSRLAEESRDGDGHASATMPTERVTADE
jgi:hypothetical protein